VRASTRSHEQKIEQLHAEARATLCHTHHDDSPAALGSSETPVGSPAVSSSSRPRGTPQEHPTGTARLGIESRRDVQLREHMNFHVDPETGCHVWDGWLNKNGYGRLYHEGREKLAHRLAWELRFGPISGELHHLCLNPVCVNTDHLMPVTSAQHKAFHGNEMAGWRRNLTHCKRGHPFDSTNTYVRPDGSGRTCLRCKAVSNRRYFARRRRSSQRLAVR
jgi:hypothetical protein